MLTQTQITVARMMRQQGKSDDDIMTRTGMSRSSIYKYCSDIPANLSERAAYRKTDTISEEKNYGKILEMWSQGYTPGFIASKLQMLSTTVDKVIKKLESSKTIHSYCVPKTVQIEQEHAEHLAIVREKEKEVREMRKNERYWDDGTSDVIDGYLKITLKKAH